MAQIRFICLKRGMFKLFAWAVNVLIEFSNFLLLKAHVILKYLMDLPAYEQDRCLQSNGRGGNKAFSMFNKSFVQY